MAPQPPFIQPHAPGVCCIDTGYLRPGAAACYLVEQNGRAAFIETNTSLAVPRLLAVLEQRGIRRENVEYVVVTHVHLDHAGGAGRLLRHLPRARLVVHPKGARHMIDPSRLVAGATLVYGEQTMQSVYGQILPIPAERVLAPQDGATLDLAGRPLVVLHTPGHARHHIAIWDEQAESIYAGDAFGLAYRVLDAPEGPLIFPTTAPVQFEPELMAASMERILRFAPGWLCLTHFGPLENQPRLAEDLLRFLKQWMNQTLALAQEDPAKRQRLLSARIFDSLLARQRELGGRQPEGILRRWLAMDVELNAQGMEVWLGRRRG